MDDSRFWAMIETAWNAVGGQSKERQRLANGELSQEVAEVLVEALDKVMAALSKQLCQLSSEELRTFDEILERKLYAIDRAEIHEFTDGSDDGFLYARGFIVAAGKEYYDAVDANPSIALYDLESEEMCYLSTHIYEERFGDIPRSGISRESHSNTAGWPEQK